MERLKRRTDFRAAAAGAAGAGRRLRAAGAPARRRTAPVRVGFTVSRQVGNAVERNRVRRRLREMVRLRKAGGMHAGHDYVLIGRRAALAPPFGQMTQELDAALGRIHAPRAEQLVQRATSRARRLVSPATGPYIAKGIAAGKTPTAPKTARALNERAQEHHPRHRAVAARRGRLAVFLRLSADGKQRSRRSSSSRNRRKRNRARRSRIRRSPAPRLEPARRRRCPAPPRPPDRIARGGDRRLAAHRHRHAAAARQHRPQGRPHRRSVARAISRDRRSRTRRRSCCSRRRARRTRFTPSSAGWPAAGTTASDAGTGHGVEAGRRRRARRRSSGDADLRQRRRA